MLGLGKRRPGAIGSARIAGILEGFRSEVAELELGISEIGERLDDIVDIENALNQEHLDLQATMTQADHVRHALRVLLGDEE